MDKEIIFEKIEAYLEGHLSATDQEIMATDPSMQSEIKLHRDLASALAETDVIQLENLLTAEGKKHRSMPEGTHNKNKIIHFISKYRSLAAGLVLLLTAAFVLQIWTNANNDPFADHFEDYPMYLNTRSGASANGLLAEAIQCYGNSQFECAFSSFSDHLKSQPQDFGAIFYTAMAALKVGKTEIAIENFLTVVEDGDNFYRSPAEWYLALAYLKNEENAPAEKVLNEIIAKNSEFKEKAIALLADLK